MTAKEIPSPSFPPLDHACKRVFPFTLACPSFVYPAGYVDNVRRLAPFVDEIELLFFESRLTDSLPSRALIRELMQLARSCDITYHVHLPSDTCLGHTEAGVRRIAVDVLSEMIDRCAPLDPTTFTLHLVRDPSEPDIGRWQRHTLQSMQALLKTGLASRRISVENIDYEFALALPVVEQLDLSVCMDMGHLMARGEDISAFFERWRERITIAHLHGVDGTRDHLPLDRLSTERMATVMERLQCFHGVVSLEVFSVAALNASMGHLQDRWTGLKAEGVCG
jgi:sugar phosphate isomerase/epimerase